MNLLVEDWGGKIQSHVSAKVGTGVKELLEKYCLKQNF
jgi:translation initiation factor IF-2